MRAFLACGAAALGCALVAGSGACRDTSVREQTARAQQAILEPTTVAAPYSDVPPGLGFPGERFGRSISSTADGLRLLVGNGQVFSPTGRIYTAPAYSFVRNGAAWELEDALDYHDATEVRGARGISVSADGTRVLVGTPHRTEYLPGSLTPGVAVVHVRTGSDWVVEQVLTSSSPVDGDCFGYGVSLSADGSRAVIGAPGIDSVPSASFVHFYVRSGSVWSEEQVVEAPTPSAFFGEYVAISGGGDRAVSSRSGVGAIFARDAGGWTLEHEILDMYGVVDMDADGSRVVAATLAGLGVWSRAGTVWTQEQVVIPDAPLFTIDSARISGDGTRIVAGDLACGAAPDPDCVGRVYGRTGTSWSEIAMLGPVEGDGGRSVAISYDGTRVFTAEDREDGMGDNRGIATTYSEVGGAFPPEATLISGDAPRDGFGSDVAIDRSGSRAVVAAPLDDVPGAADAGSVYVLERSDLEWIESDKLFAPVPVAQFGAAVDLSDDGNVMVIGAARIDEPGRAFVYERNQNGWDLTDLTDLAPCAFELGRSAAVAGDGTLVAFGTPGSSVCGVMVFARSGLSWVFDIELGNFAADAYGTSLGLSQDGTRLVVAAPQLEGEPGPVDVFVRSGTGWSSEELPVDPSWVHEGRVALSPDGASVALAVSGPSPAVAVFARSGSAWSLAESIPQTSPPTVSFSRDGARLVIGRPQEGAVDLHLFDGTAWVLDESMAAPVGADDSAFGADAAVAEGARGAVIGAPSFGTLAVDPAMGREGRAFFFSEAGQGTPCADSDDCASGFCVDGVCCDTACGDGADDCQACSIANGAAVDGTCGFYDSSVVCRPSSGVCDKEERCNGGAGQCPADAFVADGTACNESGACACASGTCSVTDCSPTVGASTTTGGGDPDDDGPQTTPPEDGCGCRFVAPRGAALPIAVGLLLLVLARRRGRSIPRR